MEFILLAGGKGTRLQSVVSDVPKPLAPIHGQPFLAYILDRIQLYNPTKIVISVGYQYEKIIQAIGYDWKNIPIEYTIEDTPLGTGGAIKKVLENTTLQNPVILNADTYFECDYQQLIHFHEKQNSTVTIALKQMYDFNRYGTLMVDENNTITAFIEKTYQQSGTINTGVYSINKAFFLDKMKDKTVFSLENDFFEKQVHNNLFKAYTLDKENYFIDIGIPEDYQKAMDYFANKINESE